MRVFKFSLYWFSALLLQFSVVVDVKSCSLAFFNCWNTFFVYFVMYCGRYFPERHLSWTLVSATRILPLSTCLPKYSFSNSSCQSWGTYVRFFLDGVFWILSLFDDPHYLFPGTSIVIVFVFLTTSVCNFFDVFGGDWFLSDDWMKQSFLSLHLCMSFVVLWLPFM